MTLGAGQADRLIAGRYRVNQRIGAGGMGAVYRARDEVLGELVALKVLHANDRTSTEQFVREVALARKVTHKNVARTFDLGFDGSSMFLTMELIEGASLREMLLKGPLAASDAGPILSQVAAGLAAAHEAAVVHRDLKPGNILVAKDGRVVIIDFGIAGATAAPSQSENVSGTLDYMAPEQIRGAAPMPPTDVYAFGLIAFRVLTGRLAFDGPSPEERAIARLTDEPPRFREVADVPPDLVALLDGTLARAPEARPSSEDLAEGFSRFSRASISTPRSSIPHLHAPTSASGPRERVMRVLPFTLEGATTATWDVGASMAEELADLLSRTRGVRVLASVLPPKHAPHATGQSVSMWASPPLVVEGAVREVGSRLVVTARLTDSATSAQLWSGRFTGSLGDVIEWGGQLAAQIAEALRLELDVRAAPLPVPDEAAELYLRARRMLRSAAARPSEALRTFDRAIALAPGFVAAEAARAVAVARTFFFADFAAGDVSQEAPRAVGRALDVAPSSPDTQLALGIVALQQGRLATAIQALERAVELAPTYALALEQIGRLEIEAGRNSAGIARLKLTAEIDPLRASCLFPIARSHALRGQIDECDRVIRKIRDVEDTVTAEETSISIRIANWTGNLARAEKAVASMPPSTPAHLFDLSARLLRGEDVTRDLNAAVERYCAMPLSPRIKAVAHQFAAELFAARNLSIATYHLNAAAAFPLLDIEWVELCPALDPLRETESFATVRRTVRERIAQLWAASAR